MSQVDGEPLVIAAFRAALKAHDGSEVGARARDRPRWGCLFLEGNPPLGPGLWGSQKENHNLGGCCFLREGSSLF